MDASLPAITPAPASPPKSPSQTSPATETASPFSDFLDAATTDNTSQDAQEAVDPELSASTSSHQEVMAAELTALSLQEMPALQISQMMTGQEASKPSASITDSSPPVTPSTPVISDIPDTPATPAAPVVNANPELNALQQMITMPADDPLTATQTAVETVLDAGEKVPSTEPLGKNTPKNTSLLTQQIESILNGDPRNTITVQSSVQQLASSDSLNGLTSPYIQSAAELTAISNSPAAKTEVDVDGKLTTDTGKSLRDTMGERSLDTKIEGISDQRSSGKQQQENGQQDNNTSQQSTTTTPLPLSQSNNEPASQFIVTGLGTQTAATTPGQTSVTQPTSLPPGAPVPAEELINHLVERFSINPRLQTSKISLNLNPAELGALKIDILVKGDSIKAHIAAGNQQIQETIEKNMPKLRTILEQQGFTVEDFKVTLESTNSGSNDFFQQQFSSRQDSSPRATPVSSLSSFELSLNSAEELLVAPPMDSGINLSI